MNGGLSLVMNKMVHIIGWIHFRGEGLHQETHNWDMKNKNKTRPVLFSIPLACPHKNYVVEISSVNRCQLILLQEAR